MEEESVSEVKVVGREGESGSLLRRSSLRLHGRSVIGEQFIGKIENSFSNEKEQVILHLPRLARQKKSCLVCSS